MFVKHGGHTLAQDLIIVESPAKAKTIAKFLGRKYRVTASMGHVRDLPRSQFGVDIENNFEPRYITIRGKGKILNELRKEARKARRVLLATDPDREGEAIAWHLSTALDLDPAGPLRIVFNEITKDAVKEGVNQPRPINTDLVDAQQARRILDRLVGYKLSPFLWRKVRRGLSAGRVQSVAVRLICDREAEIEAFEPEEYWSLTAELQTSTSDAAFEAKYYGTGAGKQDIPDQHHMEQLLESLAGARFVVRDVKKRERKRNPAAPFTTSTLQQEASRKLGFAVRRTMRTAQQLYEGLEVSGYGTIGLITYMRTDSTRLSSEAVSQAAAWIRSKYGDEYVQPRIYGPQGARAQDAHEAIRPTNVSLHPDDIKSDLTPDQYRIYKLIWERFIASQMAPAVLDTVTVDIDANGNIFRATGSTVKFPGFMSVYIEGSDDEDAAADDQEKMLPPVAPGDALKLKDLVPRQHFTQPPPRYTEAMLVKALEEYGIGRPSTYAPIIETIQERGYVERDGRSFKPTELGIAVTKLLQEHFPDIVDVEFTAQMESELDRVEDGERAWVDVVREFYDTFAEELKAADEEAARVELPVEETGEVCEVCGRPMVIKHGRFGRFLACSGYPECRNTRSIVEKVGVPCPECGGDIIARRSRKGRVFYGCSNYPECSFVSWYKPVAKSCPQCGAFLVQRRTKARGEFLQCSREGCDYTEDMAKPAGSPGNGKVAASQSARQRPRQGDAEKRLAEKARAIVRSSSR